MAAYRYGPGEAPVYEVDNVSLIKQNKGLFEKDKNGRLVLTNRNLIWLEKGAFNSIKNVCSFPLAEIQIHAGQAYISAQNAGNMFKVSFFFYQAAPTFGFHDRRSVKKLTDELNYLVGDPEVIASLNKKPANLSEGVAAIAGMFMDSIGLGDSFSLRTKAPNPASAGNNAGVVQRTVTGAGEDRSSAGQMSFRELASQRRSQSEGRTLYQRVEYGDGQRSDSTSSQPSIRAAARMVYRDNSQQDSGDSLNSRVVAIRCPFCTAPVNGVDGTVVRCEYCGSHINISECLKSEGLFE